MSKCEQIRKLRAKEVWGSYPALNRNVFDRQAAFRLAFELTFLRCCRLSYPIGTAGFWNQVVQLFREYEQQERTALAQSSSYVTAHEAT